MELSSVALSIFGIGLLIFIHEGGHFLAARAAGVRVEVFSLGFGPRLGGFRWGGTDFRLSAVPFGGYVMVAGQDPSDRRYPPEQCLWSKSVGQRALFWSGGILMNLLFALLTFPLVFSAGVRFEAPVVGAVPAGSPAWEAGLRAGDRVIQVGDKEIYSLQNMLIEVALAGKRPATLLVEAPDGARRSVSVKPRFDAEQGLYGIGIGPAYDAGAVTLTVERGGIAAQAGLRTGDRLVAVDGDEDAVFAPFDSFSPRSFTVDRPGGLETVTMTPAPTTEGVPLLIGVRPLPNRVAGIRPDAPAVAKLGLLRDDEILAIDGRCFLGGDLAAFEAGDPGETAWVVRRAGARVDLVAQASVADRQAIAANVALDTAPRLQVIPTPDGAAAASGMQPGDWLTKMDGRPLRTWEELRSAVQRQGEDPLLVTLLRPDPADVDGDGARGVEVEVRFRARREPVPDFGFTASIPPRMTEIRASSFLEAIELGTVCSLDLVKQLYVTMKRLITGEVGAKNLGGIIRISQVSYQAAQRGPSWFWYFLALLSVNLAFVNLLPIPVLDGGHLLFLLIEKVKGSPVSTKVFGYSQVIGLVFVLLLVIFVTYNDILRLL